MSVTRRLITDLRDRLDESRLGRALPGSQRTDAHGRDSSRDGGSAKSNPNIPNIPRETSTESTDSSFAEDASKHTTAMVGIGRVGTRYQTNVVLQFQAELAVAHEAVRTELPVDWAQQNGLMALQSRVADKHEYLLRPDLGRRLNDESLALLQSSALKDIDVQPILADGLSAVACMGSGMTLLESFSRECTTRGWSVGTPMCAKFARVWLEDEIGETVRAKVAVILLGERPGLGTGDGLSAYLVFNPRIGNTDGDRNMMSNIHARGTPPAQAATRLAGLTGAILEQKVSGVNLDLKGLSDLGDAGGTGYREPQPRVQLVETDMNRNGATA